MQITGNAIVSEDEIWSVQELPFTVPAVTATEIVVPQFVTVSGQVHGPEGASVAKVWVGIEYENTYSLIVEDGQTATYTDESGRFLIPNVRPGHAKLKASTDSERYTFSSELLLEPGKSFKDVRVDLTTTR